MKANFGCIDFWGYLGTTCFSLNKSKAENRNRDLYNKRDFNLSIHCNLFCKRMMKKLRYMWRKINFVFIINTTI